MSDAAEDLAQRANQAWKEGRREDARRNLLEAVELLRLDDRRSELARALRNLGEIERRTPNAEDALRHYEEAVAIYRGRAA
ncbi:MAG: tetratricopeptide repeat protein [Acidobacteriota bacterium]|nr:tetratricopeptide repeat protein [Acidobacteriota bacterium]